MGQRGKGAIFSLWEVTSHESALFELLSLLNCLHQGYYVVEEPQKQEQEYLQRSNIPGLELFVCSLRGRMEELINKSSRFQERTMAFSVTWSTAGNTGASNINSFLNTHINISSSHIYNGSISDKLDTLLFLFDLKKKFLLVEKKYVFLTLKSSSSKFINV